MAKLKLIEIHELKEISKRLENGEIETPIPTDKLGAYGEMLRILEAQRLGLLRMRTEKINEASSMQNTIANVTHDMKTPLAIIGGYAECLEDGLDDKNYPALIREKTAELNNTVLEIIDAARNAVSENKDKKRIVKLKEFIVNDENKYDSKNRLRISRVPNLQILVAETQMKRALENIVSNAYVHSESRKPIYIKFHKRLKNLIISVKDSGAGISKEDLPHIFEKFYMGDKSRTKGGSGVGLSYAKEVVEEHGGKIWCKSKLGKGATFYISIPIYQERKKTLTADEKELILEALRVFMMPFMYVYDFFRFVYLCVKIRK